MRSRPCGRAETPPAGLEVLEHVAMPLLVDDRDHRGAARRAREALDACEAEQCAGMTLEELSDGERQRVAIARAIVIEPRLLLADGPARNLSLVEQEAIMVLLSSLARDARVAVLVTDSDSEALIGADSVLYLHGGKLVNPAASARPSGQRSTSSPGAHAKPRPMPELLRAAGAARARERTESTTRAPARRSTPCAAPPSPCARASASRCSVPRAPARPRCC